MNLALFKSLFSPVSARCGAWQIMFCEVFSPSGQVLCACFIWRTNISSSLQMFFSCSHCKWWQSCSRANNVQQIIFLCLNFKIFQILDWSLWTDLSTEYANRAIQIYSLNLPLYAHTTHTWNTLIFTYVRADVSQFLGIRKILHCLISMKF